MADLALQQDGGGTAPLKPVKPSDAVLCFVCPPDAERCFVCGKVIGGVTRWWCGQGLAHYWCFSPAASPQRVAHGLGIHA